MQREPQRRDPRSLEVITLRLPTGYEETWVKDHYEDIERHHNGPFRWRWSLPGKEGEWHQIFDPIQRINEEVDDYERMMIAKNLAKFLRKAEYKPPPLPRAKKAKRKKRKLTKREIAEQEERNRRRERVMYLAQAVKQQQSEKLAAYIAQGLNIRPSFQLHNRPKPKRIDYEGDDYSAAKWSEMKALNSPGLPSQQFTKRRH